MIYLVQPPRGRSISGGYRFNDEMVRRLEADGIGRSIQMQGVLERILTPADVLVFDSLFLRHGHLENLEECPTTRCLLLHYLPSRQTKLSPSERALLRSHESGWLESVDRVLVPSRRFGNELHKKVTPGVELDLHVVTPGLHGVFRSPLPPLRERTRSTRIATVSPLTESKNLLTVLRVLEHVDPSKFRWEIAGDQNREPAYCERFREALYRSRISERVRFHEGLSPLDVVHLLDRADLYVTASLEETYGMATAEAVARGLPVLSFDVGCAARWVRPGVNGHLMRAGREHELAGALVALLYDRARLAELIEGARDMRDQVRFPSWEDTYDAFRKVCVRCPHDAFAPE